MIINLIKKTQMFSLALPDKVKGQYWLTDFDEKGEVRQLVSVEAVNDVWTLKGNKKIGILNPEEGLVDSYSITTECLLNLKFCNSEENVTLYVENIDVTRQTLKKIMVVEPTSFSIGRAEDNNFCFGNLYVSSHHAQLMYDGENWSIADVGSRNGTYVNGYSVQTQRLVPGDFIYIMGLKIVIGKNYLAVNNPDEKLKIKSNSLALFQPQKVERTDEECELPEKQFFFRSPRFHREIEHVEIKIDPPPQPQKLDTVPLALMLGPSLTMAFTSVSTGILSVTNTIANGGDFTQALPTLLMSVSMLLGTVLWPILTKRHEKKEKIKSEKKRQEKYFAYLNEIGDSVKKIAKEHEEILSENLVTHEECSDRIMNQKQNLWERVIGQSDFLRLRVGMGNVPMDVEVKYQEKRFTMEDDSLQNAMLYLAEEPKELKNVPISISLVDNIALGLYGEQKRTNNMLKSLILQMVALHSYDELKIMLIVDEDDEKQWDFVKYIPHFWNEEKTVRFFATKVDEVRELSAYIENNILVRNDSERENYAEYSPYYVVISVSRKLNKKCDALQQLLKYKNNVGFTVLFTGEMFNEFPKETKTLIQIEEMESKIFDRDDTTGAHISFWADKLDENILESISQEIANIELDNSSQRYSLPSMITFLEMFDVGKVEHLNSLTRWKENNPTKTLQTPIGVGTDGDIFNLDLHEKFHGPHGLVAGMTGSGKSEFIITYILSLAVNYHPDEVAFILIDYKGGGLTGAFEDTDRGIKLPHLAGTITNLDGAAITRSLISIQSELRRRQSIFNEARKISNEGTMDIYKYQQLYRNKVVSEPVPHLFIISDEFAELKTQQPEFMEQLISAARIGRSLGVHLILATQKPSGVVDDQIWSNSKFRVCLKVQEKADSQDMIKCPDAAELSQTGRFYLQVGFNELFALGQSAWCGADYVPSDVIEKEKDVSVQVVDNLGRVMMSVKAGKKKNVAANTLKQIVSVVKYLSDLAVEEEIAVRPLWLEPIPEFIYVEDLEKKYQRKSSGIVLNPIVGEYDDPFNQRQDVLTIPFSQDGNCLVYGATGNGKTTFLTTLCYSLVKNHSAEELNLYIMDFGSETLKVFEKAPQVGGVITSADEDKTINFIKMLRQEIDARKALFSDYGGDHASYCKNSGKIIPNIVVAINNYSGFAEQFEDLQDEFTLLTRDGVKYGIYFVVTAGSTNAVRYKVQQNFKMMLTMQLNDAADYSVVVGKTDGLVPSKYKGRGLVALDKAYEFQTAYCKECEDMQEYLRNYVRELSWITTAHARPIPVLPKVVDYDFIGKQISSLNNIPVGVRKDDLSIATVNLKNKVAMPVVAQDITEGELFINGLIAVLRTIGTTMVVDSGNTSNNVEELVWSIFDEMVLRNNTYKDAKLDESVLTQFEERVYVLIGVKKLFDQLSTDGKDKLGTLLEKAEAIYKMHFVLCDSLSQLNTFNYEAWFKKQVTGEGIWLGDGVADQYMLKVNKLTSDLYEEVGAEYGYVVSRGKPVLMKTLASNRQEER